MQFRGRQFKFYELALLREHRHVRTIASQSKRPVAVVDELPAKGNLVYAVLRYRGLDCCLTFGAFDRGNNVIEGHMHFLYGQDQIMV